MGAFYSRSRKRKTEASNYGVENLILKYEVKNRISKNIPKKRVNITQIATWGADFSYHTSGENQYRYMVQDTSQSLTSDGYTIYGELSSGEKASQIFADLNRTAIFKNATAITPAQGFVNNGNGSYTKGNRVMHSLYTGSENAVSWANGNAVDDGSKAILMSWTQQDTEGGKSYVGVASSVEFATE